MLMKNLLEVTNLSVQLKERYILDRVSFQVPQGRITAIVGASGSGKSTIASAVLGLLPSALEMTQGQILFDNKNLFLFKQEQLRLMRGSKIAMIFQEPLSAFNPLMTIAEQMDEMLEVHTDLNSAERRHRSLEALIKAEISNPQEIYKRFPHQLSGGQRQRVMIAQAVLCNPRLVIADEPTSNLDVTLQARVMGLFRQFREQGMTMLLISHDLGMVAHLADELVVLHEGKVVEFGKTVQVMKEPKHQYTRRLVEVFK